MPLPLIVCKCCSHDPALVEGLVLLLSVWYTMCGQLACTVPGLWGNKYHGCSAQVYKQSVCVCVCVCERERERERGREGGREGEGGKVGGWCVCVELFRNDSS